MVEAISFAQPFKHLTFKTLTTFNSVNSNDTNDNDGISSNGKMIAVNWKSTSSVAVFNADRAQTFDASIPLLKGHQGAIFDMQWSPFEDRLLATCADDGNVNMWVFDDYEGQTGKGHNSAPDMQLDAHNRKCMSVQWHHSVSELLATNSIDKTIKIWDINEDRCDEAIVTFTDIPDVPNCIRWSPDGKMIASMVKNKSMVVFDPRQESSVVKAAAHAGPRQQRVEWADDQTLLTTGFDQSAKRQWGAWDLRNLEQPLILGPLSEGSGIPYFHFDREYSIALVTPRGDNTAGIYHFDKSSPKVLDLMATHPFLSTTSKSFALMPKSFVDIGKQEVRRAVRITNNSKLEVISLSIPSKVGGFNQDLYPPFTSNEASNTAEAWADGTDEPPKTIQLSAQKKTNKPKQSGLSRLKTGVKAAAPATEESKGGEDVSALKAQIAQLTADLQAARSQGGAATASEDLTSIPTLGYWKIRGLAASIRMQLYFCGANFADVTYEVGDAPDFDRSSWLDVKQTLGLEYPNLPYLIDGDVKLTETVAIMQYIARKYRPDLMGTSAAEVGRVNMLSAAVVDLKMKATMPCYMGGEQEEIIDTARPLLAKIVEVMGSDQWIAGANITWLDFYFAELCDMLDKLSDGLFYAEFPSLQTYWERFITQDKLAEAWADDSKLMKTPFNNKMAKYLNE